MWFSTLYESQGKNTLPLLKVDRSKRDGEESLELAGGSPCFVSPTLIVP